jgi:hypothetical protein
MLKLNAPSNNSEQVHLHTKHANTFSNMPPTLQPNSKQSSPSVTPLFVNGLAFRLKCVQISCDFFFTQL